MIRIAKVGAVAGVVALVMALAACDRSIGLDHPVQLRVVEGELQVRICTPASVEAVRAEYRGDGEWTEFWVASGSARFLSGDTVATSDLGDIFESVIAADDPPLKAGDLVAVVFEEASSNVSASFEVSEAALEGQWIGTENNPDAPCNF
jgi:hypothetical protein